MAYNYATFLHNFLGIICIKTHMGISAPYAALQRPFDQLQRLKLPSAVTFPGMPMSLRRPTVI